MSLAGVPLGDQCPVERNTKALEVEFKKVRAFAASLQSVEKRSCQLTPEIVF